MKGQGNNDNWKLIFGIFMVLIYLGMAAILVFTNVFNIPDTYRIIIGVLFFLYGLFRGYRVWKQEF